MEYIPPKLKNLTIEGSHELCVSAAYFVCMNRHCRKSYNSWEWKFDKAQEDHNEYIAKQTERWNNLGE